MKYYFNNELRSATLFHVMLSTNTKGQRNDDKFIK